MAKQKILVSKQVPAECLAPYESEFDFVLPEDKFELSYDEILEQIQHFDGYYAIDKDVDEAVFDAAVKLKAVANYGVGYDRIDWKYATKKGIPVLNTPIQVTEATAEMAVALMMAVMRGVSRYDRDLRAHKWDFALFSDKNTLIYGSTLGIVGFGRIGKAVCRKAQGLGMRVVYHDVERATPDIEAEFNVEYLPFEDLLAQSDCVSLHVPYCPENHHLFNADTFRKMKPTAYFINTARGKLVDEQALCEALEQKTIKGAGLDVFEAEPTVSDYLLDCDSVVMTPHAGSLTMKSRVAMCDEGLAGLVAVLRGERPANVVNPSVFET